MTTDNQYFKLFTLTLKLLLPFFYFPFKFKGKSWAYFLRQDVSLYIHFSSAIQKPSCLFLGSLVAPIKPSKKGGKNFGTQFFIQKKGKKLKIS